MLIYVGVHLGKLSERDEGVIETKQVFLRPPGEATRRGLTRVLGCDRQPSYRVRLDVLIPSFRIGLAGVARLSGDLERAEREVAFAEESAKASEIRLFSNEIAVEKARVLLARGLAQDAGALLIAARDNSSRTIYRRQELDRLLNELEASGALAKVAG